jgi:transposase
LYKIEDEIRGKLPNERRAVRQAHAAPLLKDLYDWLRTTVRQVSKKSPIASAIGYTLSLWPALTRYAEDASIEIDKAMISYCTSLAGLSLAGILSVH